MGSSWHTRLPKQGHCPAPLRAGCGCVTESCVQLAVSSKVCQFSGAALLLSHCLELRVWWWGQQQPLWTHEAEVMEPRAKGVLGLRQAGQPAQTAVQQRARHLITSALLSS